MDESQKQPRNPNDLLIIQNIDTKDFEWNYDTIKTPLPYYLRAGEKRNLPFFIARHGVEKLIDRMLMDQNKNHTNPIARDELRKKIVLGVEHINLYREKTANEIALEEMKRQKDADPLEELLKSRDIEAERLRQAQIVQAQPKAPLVEIQGAPVVTDAMPKISNPETTPTSSPLDSALNNIDAPAPIDPARQAVYDFAVNTMHMDLTHEPTKQKFDATPLEQLKTDLGYTEVTA